MKHDTGNDIVSLTKKGLADFARLKNLKESNKSPTEKSKIAKEELDLKIKFCKKVLKIHKENQNHIMIGHKTAELKDLEKLREKL